MPRRLALLAIVMAVAVEGALFPGAGKAETPAASPEKDTPVIVFAAASTKTALDAVAAAWKTNTGKTASIAYASSGNLAKQIEQGAPADIFISADLKWMDYLQKTKLIRAGTRRKLLGNKLVLIEPGDADAKLEITKGFDLAGPRAMAKSLSAPRLMSRRHLREGSARIARSFREC
jgi:molybdate transport system substrate-binding protein